eukprot:CAMPEP_0171687328 /NCGR_PEP_ID=MMETSP0991-20121206/3294_1 /TAXON_ID=483369 /ORGANISM="non described non described, Strain CCMP2098" /LENGTH=507 /DNA_ID=CAMNT_0012275177 /DNA_START=70 /DNA_END=1591 /DNA_ORIENTATION=-
MAFGISLPALEKTVEIGVMHVAFWVIGLVVVLMLCMCGFGLEFIYHGGLQRIRNKNRQSSATPADGLSQVEEGGAEEVNALRPLGTSLFRHTSPRNKKQTQTAGASSKVKSRSFTGSSKSKSSSRAVKPNGPSTPGGSFDLALHLAQLKELLAKDDEARAAEEIELSRLSNYSWNETSTPAANEVMKNAIATTHELEAATVAAELHRRIKTAIKGHESVLEELFFSNESGAAQGGEGEADTPSPRPLVVDPERFRSDGDYRQHALACTALVERFGRGNVERTLREVQRRKQELRGQASRQSCRGSGGGGGGGRSGAVPISVPSRLLRRHQPAFSLLPRKSNVNGNVNGKVNVRQVNFTFTFDLPLPLCSECVVESFPSNTELLPRFTSEPMLARYVNLARETVLNTPYVFDFEASVSGDKFDSLQALTMVGRRRIDHLHALIQDVIWRSVPGDIIECGCWRGGVSLFAAAALVAYGETSDSETNYGEASGGEAWQAGKQQQRQQGQQ